MLKKTTKSIPLHDLDAYRSSSCKFCTDPGSRRSRPLFWRLPIPALVYEIFNEAVDSGYIRSKTLEENEMERVLNLVRMGRFKKCGLDRRQVI
jgi:coenzyme F420 hydrogenase subunit beta